MEYRGYLHREVVCQSVKSTEKYGSIALVYQLALKSHPAACFCTGHHICYLARVPLPDALPDTTLTIIHNLTGI